MQKPETPPRGALVIESRLPASTAAEVLPDQPTRKRGPGLQLYVSNHYKKALQAYADKSGRFVKSCADEAIANFLTERGVDVSLLGKDDE